MEKNEKKLIRELFSRSFATYFMWLASGLLFLGFMEFLVWMHELFYLPDFAQIFSLLLSVFLVFILYTIVFFIYQSYQLIFRSTS